MHLLHLNDPQFFPGSGDGAEQWFDTQSEFDLAGILRNRSNQTVSIAAHPHYKVPFLHRLLIDRDEWHLNDLLANGLEGAQILSGTPGSQDFQVSRQLWIEALLTGKYLAVYGGSDAHGNFNIFRQVKMPMFKLFQMDDQILGQARTLIHAEDNNIATLIDNMQHRRTAATSGPAGNLMLINDAGDDYGIGAIVRLAKPGAISLKIAGHSTTEFGEIEQIQLYQGNLVTQKEQILWQHSPATLATEHSMTVQIEHACYFRLELKTPGNGRWPGVYMSSPIWVQV